MNLAQNLRGTFNSYRFTQTTDGTNDYYVGINGVNGFSIAPFAGVGTMTFSILINFPSVINSSSPQARILEIANSARTSLFGVDIGAFSSGITGEYIGVFTNLAGNVRSSGVTTGGGSISAGWHMITVGINSTTLVVTLYIDGVLQPLTNTASGAPQSVSSGFTANQVSLMATTLGGVPYGCTWREAFFAGTSFDTGVGIPGLYNYYTKRNNISLAISDRTAWRFMCSGLSRPQVIALYKGNESGNDLLDSVRTASDLTKTNF